MPYVAVEKLQNLQDGYRKLLRIAGQELLLLHEQGKTCLIKNACPHMGAPLITATLVNNYLRCPMHGIAFDLKTGRAVNAPGCTGSLQFLPLIYEGNTVGIDDVNY